MIATLPCVDDFFLGLVQESWKSRGEGEVAFCGEREGQRDFVAYILRQRTKAFQTFFTLTGPVKKLKKSLAGKTRKNEIIRWLNFPQIKAHLIAILIFIFLILNESTRHFYFLNDWLSIYFCSLSEWILHSFFDSLDLLTFPFKIEPLGDVFWEPLHDRWSYRNLQHFLQRTALVL